MQKTVYKEFRLMKHNISENVRVPGKYVIKESTLIASREKWII